MKAFVKFLILPSLFFLSTTTAKATSSPTLDKKAKKCAVYKKNVKKAKKLYSVNKKKAKKLSVQLKALAKDQKRMPADAESAKKIVSKKIQKLKMAKKKKVFKSKRYLKKLKKYKKAAKRTCAQKRAERNKKYQGHELDKYTNMAGV